MMSYTMACTSSCSIGGRLMRRMSPWTRIIGGSPDERCRSDALFLTAKARSSVMSIYNPLRLSPAAGRSWRFGRSLAGKARKKRALWAGCRCHGIMARYERALQEAKARVSAAARAAGRDPAEVTLLAVSKTFPSAAIREAHADGQRAFGENYVQEASVKRDELGDLVDVCWVLIGPLQSNKTALAAEVFDRVESVDRLKVAQRLSAARSAGRA